MELTPLQIEQLRSLKQKQCEGVSAMVQGIEKDLSAEKAMGLVEIVMRASLAVGELADGDAEALILHAWLAKFLAKASEDAKEWFTTFSPDVLAAWSEFKAKGGQ